MMKTVGIVTKPTVAFIGERGPEAVVPLNKGFGGVNIYMDGAIVLGTPDGARQFAEAAGPAISRWMARQ